MNFVRNGGTLVCLNQSSELIIKGFGLPITNAVAGLSRREFFTGGSVLEVETNQSHQVMSGMKEMANIFVWRSPVFETMEGFDGEVLASYRDYGSPLKSGYLLGERFLHGKATALDVKHGEGHVILLGFRPSMARPNFWYI